MALELSTEVTLLGFVFTIVQSAVSLTWAVAKIKNDTADKIAAERETFTSELKAITEKLTSDHQELLATFVDGQATQDQRAGELGASLRQYIADVEKEMHKIEIWGRDHYVLRSDFIAAIDRLSSDIKEQGGEIKRDIRRLSDHRHPTPAME